MFANTRVESVDEAIKTYGDQWYGYDDPESDHHEINSENDKAQSKSEIENENDNDNNADNTFDGFDGFDAVNGLGGDNGFDDSDAFQNFDGESGCKGKEINITEFKESTFAGFGNDTILHLMVITIVKSILQDMVHHVWNWIRFNRNLHLQHN